MKKLLVAFGLGVIVAVIWTVACWNVQRPPGQGTNALWLIVDVILFGATIITYAVTEDRTITPTPVVVIRFTDGLGTSDEEVETWLPDQYVPPKG